MTEDEAIATIQALNERFAEALKTRDFAALGAMFTNDAIFCPSERQYDNRQRQHSIVLGTRQNHSNHAFRFATRQNAGS